MPKHAIKANQENDVKHIKKVAPNPQSAKPETTLDGPHGASAAEQATHAARRVRTAAKCIPVEG